MEIAFTRGAVAAEGERDVVFALELRRLPDAAGHRQHRRQVRDHPDDTPLRQPEVEGAIAAFGVAASLAHELAKQGLEGQPTHGPHAQVAMQRQDDIARLERPGTADGDSLLPVSAEPLSDTVLPDQPQHLLLDGARQTQGAVEGFQIDVGVGVGRGRGHWFSVKKNKGTRMTRDFTDFHRIKHDKEIYDSNQKPTYCPFPKTVVRIVRKSILKSIRRLMFSI